MPASIWPITLQSCVDRRGSGLHKEGNMAKTKKSQRAAARATGPAVKGLAIAAIAGTFAYRFSGYAMHQDRPWWLTGLGQFKIDAKGNLTGAHRSTITPI